MSSRIDTHRSSSVSSRHKGQTVTLYGIGDDNERRDLSPSEAIFIDALRTNNVEVLRSHIHAMSNRFETFFFGTTKDNVRVVQLSFDALALSLTFNTAHACCDDFCSTS